jgi:hypothetical protein
VEQTGKRADAVKPDREAGVGHGFPKSKHLFGMCDPHLGQVLMRRLTVDRLEKPKEMEFRKAGLVRNVTEINGRRKMFVDKKLSFNYASIQVLFRIRFQLACSLYSITADSNKVSLTFKMRGDLGRGLLSDKRSQFLCRSFCDPLDRSEMPKQLHFTFIPDTGYF